MVILEIYQTQNKTIAYTKKYNWACLNDIKEKDTLIFKLAQLDILYFLIFYLWELHSGIVFKIRALNAPVAVIEYSGPMSPWLESTK